MYGSAGTGKTLILCEALKIKLSQLRSQGRRVRILATGFDNVTTTELLNNFRTKYLVNMKDIEVIRLKELCRELQLNIGNYDRRSNVIKIITYNVVFYSKCINVNLRTRYFITDIINILCVH